MAEAEQAAAPEEADEPQPERRPGPVRIFAATAGGYWRDPKTRVQAWILVGGLVALGLIQIGIAIWTNLWHKDFFNAIERRDIPGTIRQIAIFAVIVVAGVAAIRTHLQVKRRLQVRWRQWLSHHSLDRWLDQGRHYQIQFLPGPHDNPDGRIAEDVRISTEYAVEFAHSIFYCSLLLVTFLGILWNLSGDLTIDLAGTDVVIGGYMVWAALLYSGLGSLLTFLSGRPLVRATDSRQSREADFRFGLVRVRENAEGIAFLRGEADERRRLYAGFAGIIGAWNLQTTGQGRLIMLTSAYGTLAAIFPIIVAAPRYFTGAITLGGLMQTAQAFVQVQSALSWLVDNFPRFAEWRASVERVVQLMDALDELEESAAAADDVTIEVAPGPETVLRFKGVDIAQPDGNVLVSGATAEIRLGERVLVKGESGTGKSTLLRAVAGLWPWGTGAIELPAEGKLMFMPQRPYLPIGTLRAALLYPDTPDSRPDDDLAAALRAVGLDDLPGRLDEEEQWDRQLSGGEQQRVAFARLLLHRPDWIFLDEATSALDEENQGRMMTVLAENLADSTVISVGHRPGLEHFHQRELVLVKTDEGARLVKRARARREVREEPRRRRNRWQRLMRTVRKRKRAST
jgi:putative ATP-binding cassette transporter